MTGKDVELYNLDIGYVTAIIVTFHPDVEQLKRNCSNLLAHVHNVLIVDNTGGESTLAKLDFPDNVFFLSFSENKGVGTALNTGIDWAQQKGADLVLLLDQDSEITVPMVDELKTAMNFLLEKNVQVVAVGPQAFSKLNSKPEPFKGVKRKLNESIVEVGYLHTSGTLVNLKVFKQAGVLLESFFIDMIDIEWCFRAASKRLYCFGVENAKIYHDVGEKKDFLRRSVSVHAPLRTYYQTRNWLQLFKMDHVPKVWWGLYGAKHIIFRFAALLLLASNKRQRLKCFLYGAWHGIIGRQGKHTL